MRAVVDIIDIHAAELLELSVQVGVNLHIDGVRRIGVVRIVRLIQSQAQNGAASPIPHEADKQPFSFGPIGPKDFINFPAGDFRDVDHALGSPR